MTVDLGNIKVGDLVTIGPFRVEDVGCDDETNFSIHLPYGLGEYWLELSDITSKVSGPRKLRNGDRVKAKDWPDTGTVAGVYAHEVWVKWDGDSDHHPIWPADRLVVLEP